MRQLSRDATRPSRAHFSLNQVESNDPDAVYTLTQKERELRFPFRITEDGNIELTEELDREDKSMVSARLKHNIHSAAAQKKKKKGFSR